MPTSSRASGPVACACARSPTATSSWSACARPRSSAARSPSPTCSRSSGWPRSRKESARRETETEPRVSPVTTDEISEKYLKKAIGEINELADEIARAGKGERVPVLGSGHPRADVFLLKYRPQPAEVQEGVSFYGGAGQALRKSLDRLRVDPLAVYGTNCLKFADGNEEECRPFLVRELHIVQPKLVVVMGEDALAFLNGLELPLSNH